MSEFSATPFPFVYASYRLTLIRSPQKSNKKNREFWASAVALFIKDKFSAADTNSKNTSMTYQM